MFIVGSVLSSLALASSPGMMAPSAAELQNSTANVYADDLFAGDDIFAGETPLTNTELKAARGGVAFRGANFSIGAQATRNSMQSMLTATATVRKPPSAPVNTGVGPVSVANVNSQRGDRGRGVNLGPVNTGVGPVNLGAPTQSGGANNAGAANGVGPVNLGPVNVGPVNVNVGPVNTGVGPVQTAVADTGVGPVDLNVGPVNIETGPVDTGVGPVAVNVGPVDINVGPVDVNVGPVNVNVGPVETGVGPVATNVIPSTPVVVDVNPQTDVDLTPPAPAQNAGPSVADLPPIVPEAPGPSQSFQDAISTIQVTMGPNATLDVYSGGPTPGAQASETAKNGQHIFQASVPLNSDLENLVVNNALSNITIERTINITIELPFDLNETIIRPAADMHALSRTLGSASMLRGFGN